MTRRNWPVDVTDMAQSLPTSTLASSVSIYLYYKSRIPEDWMISVVETADKSNAKKWKQVFSNNMSQKSTPKITENKKSEEFTKITFTPDLARFGMTSIDDDTYSLLMKRVYDMAGTVKDIKVFLNDERLKIKGFKQASLQVSTALTPVRRNVPRVGEQNYGRWNQTTDHLRSCKRWTLRGCICTLRWRAASRLVRQLHFNDQRWNPCWYGCYSTCQQIVSPVLISDLTFKDRAD